MSGLPGASGTPPGPDPQGRLTVPRTCPHLPAATSLWPMCPHRNLPCFQRFGDGDARRLSSWGRPPPDKLPSCVTTTASLPGGFVSGQWPKPVCVGPGAGCSCAPAPRLRAPKEPQCSLSGNGLETALSWPSQPRRPDGPWGVPSGLASGAGVGGRLAGAAAGALVHPPWGPLPGPL